MGHKPTASIKHKKLNGENSPKAYRKKSLANTSGASRILYAGKMSSKDRRLLKMILVIFLSFLTCYLPITVIKVYSALANIHFVFISSYLLIYLSVCLNPLIYVLMSKEYRKAYLMLLCRLLCRREWISLISLWGGYICVIFSNWFYQELFKSVNREIFFLLNCELKLK